MIPVPRRPGRMSRQLHAPKQVFLLGPGEIRKVNNGQSTWFGRQCRPPDPGGFDIEALFGSAGYGRRAIAQRRRTLLEQPALARETRSVHRHCAALRGVGAGIRTGSLLLHRPPRALARPVAWRPGRAPAVPCAERLGACVTVPHRACEAGRPLPFAQSLPPPARTPPADDPRETLHCPDATAECRCAPGRQPQRAACASILSRRNRRCGHTLILHCSPHRVDAKNRRPILKNVSYGPFDRRQLPRGGRHAARASQTCQEHSVRPHARARCALQLCGW